MTTKRTILQIIQGDLLKQNVEAIVNAANPFLEGGGGVDGKIHQAAGPRLLQACQEFKKKNRISKIEVAECVLTESFDIQKSNPSIHYVIHTVGPTANTAKREELLHKAYQNVLDKACKNKIRSIAFPAISTGIYGYPFKEAQIVAMKAIEEYLEKYPDCFSEILLVYYSEEDFKIAKELKDVR